MKLSVIKPFRDKDDYSKAYVVGDTISVSRDRGEHIVSLGLAVEVQERLVPEPEAPAVEPEAPAVEPEAPAVESETARKKPRKSKETETSSLLRT